MQMDSLELEYSEELIETEQFSARSLLSYLTN